MTQIKGYDTCARLSEPWNNSLFNAILSDPWHNEGEPFFIGRYLTKVKEDKVITNEEAALFCKKWH